MEERRKEERERNTQARRNSRQVEERRVLEQEINTELRRKARKNEKIREEERERNTEARRNLRQDEERRVKERERDAVLRRNARKDEDRKEEEHGRNTKILSLRGLRQYQGKHLHIEKLIEGLNEVDITQCKVSGDSINFDERAIITHDCVEFNVKCQFTVERDVLQENFQETEIFCRVAIKREADSNGEVSTYPNILQDLLTNKNNPFYLNFRANIRIYNSALSFAFMGVAIVDVSVHGPYVFKVHVYHRTSHIEPLDGSTPKFAQLYVIDSSEATEKRMKQRETERCLPEVMCLIDNFIRSNKIHRGS
ncbi:hypothetical protein J437_LFUL009619 [Ladona fulva]|uniref:Uncharacterized protein n=1 Tax=Ladona fulva TaxID=123851 RepID=A0A8K0KET5_LADFU|nr:hypothetical protein J437_LFUL009619 [Ladona fulva]